VADGGGVGVAETGERSVEGGAWGVVTGAVLGATSAGFEEEAGGDGCAAKGSPQATTPRLNAIVHHLAVQIRLTGRA
jgi:hypothetical protein